MILEVKIDEKNSSLPVLIGLALISACQSKENNLITIEGEAQGTTWHISYISEDTINHKEGHRLHFKGY
jgi:thiamine biosynthesis lipoprotein ApbE